MAHTPLEHAFDEVVSAVARTLKPIGFARRGLVLRVIDNSNAAIVEFQQSDKSSEERLFFTINLGVVCGDLLVSGVSDLRNACSMDAHLRQRIGTLLPDRKDKWWELTESSNIDSTAKELSELVAREAVPYIKSYLSTDALIRLWESGKSPGLTAVQRARFLSQLKKGRSAAH